MFNADEIRRNVTGAWTIMKGDAGGVALLDTSYEGFWRSFAVFFLLVPIFAMGLLSHLQIMAEDGLTVGSGMAGYVFAVFVARGLEWVAFPAILAVAAQALRIDRKYIPFIVARNWASLIIAGFYAPPLLLHVLGVVPTGLVILAGFVILIVATYFSFRIVRLCLEVDGTMAAGIVAFDFVLALAIMDLVPDAYPIPS